MIQEVITKRNFELVPVATSGDELAEDALPPLGGEGLFVDEMQAALAEGKIDLAVHHAKDLAGIVPEQVVLASVPARIDPREAFLTRSGMGMHALQPGTRIGVSSRRRAAQIMSLNRGFVATPVCGNVDIRLRRLTAGEVDALVLSVAGLKRLGKDARITEILPIDFMLPSPGQGLLAVQCRAVDKDMRAALAKIEDPGSRRAFDAERAFLLALGGDPQMPIGALAKLDGPMIKLRGFISNLSGTRIIRDSEIGDDPEKVGVALAQRMIDAGAEDLFAGSSSSV
ncbi:MAG: hydroxymethylbilane synthase [Actinomycetota bacterium]